MAQKRYKQRQSKSKRNKHEIAGLILIIISALLLLCIVIPPILGVISRGIFSMMLGVFGIMSYPMLIALLVLGICLMTHRSLGVSLKNTVCISLIVAFALIIFQLASTHAFLSAEFSDYISDVYKAKYSMGGVVVGLLAFGLKSILTEVGCYIIFSVALLITVAVMINIKALITGKKDRGEIETADMPPAPDFATRVDPQGVVPVTSDRNLFVGTVTRKTPAVFTETGISSDLPRGKKQEVKEYGDTPVVSDEEFYSDRPATPKTDSANMAKTAARMQLYSDTDDLYRRDAEEYKMRCEELNKPKSTQYTSPSAYAAPSYTSPASNPPPYTSPSPYTSPAFSEELLEPHVRTEKDAEAQAYKPKKIVHEDHSVFFPVEKHFDFNDDGIENADEIKLKLQEDTLKRKRSDRGSVERFEHIDYAQKPEKPSEESAKPSAPTVFMPIKSAPEVFSDDPIIDADTVNVPLSKPEEQPAVNLAPIIDDVPPKTRESADDRFLRTFGGTPVMESDARDDIINTDILRGSSSYMAKPAVDEPVVNPDDIIIGDGKSKDERIIGGGDRIGFMPPREPDDDIITGSGDDGIIESIDDLEALSASSDARQDPDEDLKPIGNIGGLSIDNGPAVDMSETHDITSDVITGGDTSGAYVPADSEVNKPPKKKSKNDPLDGQGTIEDLLSKKAEESVVTVSQKRRKKYNYTPPPIDLLKKYSSDGVSEEQLQQNAELLAAVITDHLKVETKVVNIVPGPTVTRYEVECPMGTNVNLIGTEACVKKIMYELMAIGAPRIEAPIPGKRAVGIEIPNIKTQTVGIREIIESDEFVKAKSPMTFAVGKGISGDIVTCDLEKVPHLLIAGQTGSGKSACLNGLIVSLMFKSSPEDLRFILIDPKRVEFSAYSNMPHLLFDKILVDSKEVFNALKWAENEMERRYTVLSKYRCNQISGYNKHPDVVGGKADRMPHIIIICDELGNLMLSADKQGIEEKIKNIAAKARAAGIHLILATQRPSADVITGTIKANLTSQIAFKVGKQIDSRIILDEAGAETLVGKGDMLFYPVEYNAPKRVQGSFISEEEVASVIDYLMNNVECDFDEDAEKAVLGTGAGEGGDPDAGMAKAMGDPLLERVLALVIRTKQASTSGIQRRFSIGFARASRLMDMMSELKYIGPATGNSKPREVFITREQYQEMFGHDVDDGN